MRRILFVGLMLAGFGPMLHAADSDVIARAGDTVLTAADVRKLMAQTPNVLRTEADMERLVRTEIIRKKVSGEARRQGYDKKAEVLALMERASDQALVTAYMNTLARPAADFPPEALLKQVYEANKARFTAPMQFQVSQIYLAGKDAATAKQAEELHRQATRKNANFSDVARQSSQHKASAAQGGNMGWLSAAEMQPTFLAALEGMNKGETSKPLVGAEGYHILRLTDKKPAEIQPFEKVKPTLIQSLRARKAQETEAAYLEDLMAKSPIAINAIALGELSKAEKY